MQDDIARRVVGAAAVKLTRFEQERVLDEAHRTTSRPTNTCCAVAISCRMQLATRTTRRPRSSSARSTSTRATPRPMRRSAGSHYEAVVSGWTEFREEELERAETLAQKALALDPDDDERLPPACQSSTCTKDVTISHWGRSTARSRSIPAMRKATDTRGNILVWAGRAGEALPWLESALRFDRAHTSDGCIGSMHGVLFSRPLRRSRRGR